MVRPQPRPAPGATAPRTTPRTPYGVLSPRSVRGAGGLPRLRLARTAAAAVVLAVLGALLAGAVVPASAAPAGFVALPSPARLLDTRSGAMPTPGQVLQVPVLGQSGVPASGVGAVSLNLTAVSAASGGFVSVYPCGDQPPASSTINLVVGQTIPNAVVVGVGDGGAVCVLTQGRTHVLVDVAGWFADTGVTPLATPVRLVDTRPAQPAVDTAVSNGGPVAAGSELVVPVAGQGGIDPAATSAVLNLTVVGARTPGFLSVYPCGSRPTTWTSTITYAPGTTRANGAVSGLGTSGAGAGAVCVYSQGSTDVLVDVTATLPTSTFVPLSQPARLLDTRPLPTADGQMTGLGAEPANATLTLPLAGRSGLGAATAVVLNVTAVNPSGSGYTAVFPQGPTVPATSNLNYGKGQTVSNLVVAPLAPDGSVCLTTAGVSADLVVDVAGALTSAQPSGATTPCPSVVVNTSPDAVRGALVYRPAMQRVVGTDRIAVVKCLVPDGYPGYDASWTAINPASTDTGALATWANTTVAKYYANVSGGAYKPVFTNVSTSSATTVDLSKLTKRTGPSDCLDQALALPAAATSTNVMVVDNRMTPFGFGGPGYLPNPSSTNQDVLHQGTPAKSGRGFFVGGLPAFYGQSSTSSTPDQRNIALVAHELGHTLHWPHSFHTPAAGQDADEYDSPVDLMSGNAGAPGNGWCQDSFSPPKFQYACKPQSALAFDRMAAGWMTSRQSMVQSGVTTYTLDVPTNDATNTGGLQLVAVKDPRDPFSALTIEGRPAVTGPNGPSAGPADGLLSGSYCHVVPDPSSSTGGTKCDPTMTGAAHDGVLVSFVRESAKAVASSPTGCYDHSSSNQAYWIDLGYGLCRRAAPALGDPYTFDSLLQVGADVTVAGVHITVLGRSGNTFTVRVSGTYTTPSSMTAPVGSTVAPSAARAASPEGADGTPGTPGATADGSPLRTTPEEVQGTRH